MTMETKKEIFDEHKARYWQSNRKEKGEILSHICAVTGMHRKAAVRKFSKLQRRDPLRFDQRGRRAYYTPDVTAALKEVWEVGDQACGEDLHQRIAQGSFHHQTVRYSLHHSCFQGSVDKFTARPRPTGHRWSLRSECGRRLCFYGQLHRCRHLMGHTESPMEQRSGGDSSEHESHQGKAAYTVA